MIVWILCGVCNHTITLSPDGALYLTNCQTDTSVAVQSERVSELTLVVNGINNILTSTNNIMTLWALVVSILTLLLAALGLIGYHELKKEVKEQTKGQQDQLNALRQEFDKKIAEYKQEFDKKIAEYKQESDKKIAEYRQETDKKIAEYERKIDDCLKTTEEIRRNYAKIENKQSLSNLYMQRINQWMYENTNNIAQVSGSDSAKDIMNKAFLNYYLMKLHLCDDKTGIDECISRIKYKGGEDEIEALQLIVDNDMNKYKKEKAIEAIGYISGRLS